MAFSSSAVRPRNILHTRRSLTAPTVPDVWLCVYSTCDSLPHSSILDHSSMRTVSIPIAARVRRKYLEILCYLIYFRFYQEVSCVLIGSGAD